MNARLTSLLLLPWQVLLAGCPEAAPTETGPPELASGGTVAVSVELPDGAGAGLQHAAEDLTDAFAQITGASPAPGATRHVIRVQLDASADAALGDEGYALSTEGGQLEVLARSETGAMYGLYRIAMDLGVRYYHPEESFFPSDPEARLPWDYTGAIDTPRFALRGFHEHTQHPIVMSDFLLRPGDPGFREHLSRYLRWMARNRQNVLSWHMLKTVDLDSWLPYMADVAAEANAHGVEVGAYVSFADQQQNCFKLIYPDRVDPTTGELMPVEDQIRSSIDRLAEAGLNILGFQFGTSEFTKADETETLYQLNTAVAHLRDHHPDIQAFAWIHTTCGLETDAGGYFYHLPLDADADLGAFVHTTMFYTLQHPAPVYGCEDFTQQQDFMTAADGQRLQVYFPETAWWLGFDNNLPLLLPVTGRSREFDILNVLPGHDVSGHVTFTSGREWTYWQYDHYLTQVTWDGTTTWNDYLAWIAPVYGERGEQARLALTEWTDRQWQHFYQDNPLIYFYLAGELPQDEIGAAAGILARRPKLSYQTVVAMDDAEYAAWEASDLDMLRWMKGDYEAIMGTLPEPSDDDPALYRELHGGLTVYVLRIDHAIALYEGVGFVRAGDETQANARLEAARAISADAQALITAGEALYRYDLGLLTQPKPETPTAYPYGYLAETSTAYFWNRRDDQLDTLIKTTFGGAEESWENEPSQLFLTVAEELEVLEPASPAAAEILRGFIPTMLYGLSNWDAASGSLTVILGQDSNGNQLPDAGSELRLDGKVEAGQWSATTAAYALKVRDSTGAQLGDLVLVNPEFVLEPTIEADAITGLAGGSVSGTIPSQLLVDIVVSVGGIDEEGVRELIKGVWELDAELPLPEQLPFALGLGFKGTS